MAFFDDSLAPFPDGSFADSPASFFPVSLFPGFFLPASFSEDPFVPLPDFSSFSCEGSLAVPLPFSPDLPFSFSFSASFFPESSFPVEPSPLWDGLGSAGFWDCSGACGAGDSPPEDGGCAVVSGVALGAGAGESFLPLSPGSGASLPLSSESGVPPVSGCGAALLLVPASGVPLLLVPEFSAAESDVPLLLAPVSDVLLFLVRESDVPLLLVSASGVPLLLASGCGAVLRTAVRARPFSGSVERCGSGSELLDAFRFGADFSGASRVVLRSVRSVRPVSRSVSRSVSRLEGRPESSVALRPVPGEPSAFLCADSDRVVGSDRGAERDSGAGSDRGARSEPDRDVVPD
ncbi:hypothetical protein ACWDR1_05185 [Streptosporangium sandarakinum]